jgi:UDP-N-acetylmuramate dehydrogenase
METSLQHLLNQAFPDLPFRWQYPLAQQTYFKLGGPAEAYLELADKQTIIDVVGYCRKNKLPLTIFGGASNVIVADKGIAGLVLKLTNDQVTIEGTKVTAGAGIKTALLVRKAVDHSLTGLEYFLGVPGNLGGAVFNNAHYLQHLIGEFITRVEVINEDGTTSWLSHDECDFSYDHSRFQKTKEIILTVEFELQPGKIEDSQALIKEATVYRAMTQPLGEPSSGCIFQNVPVTPELATRFPQYQGKKLIGGGFLIDQAGLKGAHEGDIEVSHKHAAFFVNKGTGTATQTKKLIARVQARVKELFGVQLQTEVFFLGNDEVVPDTTIQS